MPAIANRATATPSGIDYEAFEAQCERYHLEHEAAIERAPMLGRCCCQSARSCPVHQAVDQ